MKTVKFLDLKAQYPLIKSEILKKFDDIIESASFISDKYVNEFEHLFAKYLGVKHCIAVNNGTNALFVSMLANGIGFGDEVIIPVNTFVATAEAVSLTGAKPVFVDINEKTYLIDPDRIKEKITKRTKAIIAVHLYGQCADMDKILKIGRRYNLIIIEDACQAHGAKYKKRKAGSMAQCGAFSFHPVKNLGAWGEGGAIVTNNNQVAKKIRLIRDYGFKTRYRYEISGGNFKMDEFQGAVLLTKIKYLENWNKKRCENAKLYLKLLKRNSHITLPFVENYNQPAWHLFVIRVKEREKLLKHLINNGVGTAVHYPVPLHLTNAYKHLGYQKGDFPIAEKISKEILSLPLYPELKKKEIIYIVNVINRFYNI